MPHSSLSTSKYVLITNIRLSNYAGSELNCLSLAKALRDMGYIVEVATLQFSSPMKDEFEKEEIPVRIITEEPLSRTHYDLIWAHHAITIDYLLFTKSITADRLILSSLSPFEPYEALPSYANVCSLCLANSAETKDALIAEGVKSDHILVFPNYVDAQWLSALPKDILPQQPKKIAIVSNHLADELLVARNKLIEQGCTVDIYGSGFKTVMIQPEVLLPYDLVITIGKTVQFAMSLKIPVYCYDIYGGPGYLSQDNLDLAAYKNFSGRGFNKKSPDEITEEILFEYDNGKNMCDVLFEYIKQNAILEQNIRQVLTIVDKTATLNCAEDFRNYTVIRRHNFALVRLFQQYLQLSSAYDELSSAYDELSLSYRNFASEIYNSKSWRITKGLRWISSKLRN